ncbi:MAG: DUF433 domain-containing protein [Gemmatimonadetes bacterium]|nr:DUF433 domain-containing protein [Gemmatimonadota bacterium]
MPKTAAPKSLRLPVRLARAIELEARRSGRSFTAVATEMLEEAARTRRFRHIVFTGPPGRRRACIAGAGIDVWEVVRDYRAAGESLPRLVRQLHWVPRDKLEEALAYAAAHPEEIKERLEREQAWTEESAREALPWSVPATRSRRR